MRKRSEGGRPMDRSVRTACGITSNSWVVPRSNGSKGGAGGPEGRREGEPWGGNSGGVTELSCGYRDSTPAEVTQSKESTI